MDKVTKYIAQGVVYGNYWGGGSGTYSSKIIYANSSEDLNLQIHKGIEDGSLDWGMGYERLLAAAMNITVINTIVFEDEEYVNEQYYTQYFGTDNLTDEQIDFLEEALDNFINYGE